ncbi:hypothetical protein FKR81_08975 [Lentzea tibetensis]|uniref:Uncharacterized protein n=1 Tax=Lentzea tibetensis TaxID=2591470 RepID=A0A563EXM4_9PSEU|nr:hypothetical protein [Lentzea tibetensis]TWP52455.1 hypothetical protein FKR81_08975 [Lentzea tibetensis]
MTEVDQSRFAALAGFTIPVALMVLTIVAFTGDYLDVLGWQGGEYGYAFLWIAIGSVVLGVVTKAAAPAPWRSAGSGMVLAGTIGVVLTIAAVMLFMWAFAHSSWTF